MKIPPLDSSLHAILWENGQDDCWASDMHKTKRKLILGNLQNFFLVWLGIGETIYQTFPTYDQEILGKILNKEEIKNEKLENEVSTPRHQPLFWLENFV
jgi:hypothetical protein